MIGQERMLGTYKNATEGKATLLYLVTLWSLLADRNFGTIFGQNETWNNM